MKKITLFVTLLLTIIAQNTIAQASLVEIPLQQQVERSSLIVEGKVIAKKSFWNENNGLIYTANTVEVYKVFKGDAIETIDVITVGGTVGLRALIANHSLKLYSGDIGIFTLYNSNVSNSLSGKTVNKQYRPYSSQGFYRYNLFSDLAANEFNKKKGIKTSFYNEIINLTGQGYVQIKEFDPNYKSKRSKGLLPPSSLTLNKSVVTAGTGDELIITGTGFGAIKGKVWFSNSDGGGANLIAALDSQVTWSDTSITVEVPSKAGTGSVVVEDSDNDESPPAALTVSYAEINVRFSGNDYQVQHISDNGSGGYTWEMYTDFFNDTEHPGAKAAFERAFDKWVCETGVNWEISDTATSTDVIGIVDFVAPFDGELDPEGVNVIRFDNGSELGAGVLGTCYSWYSSCNGTDWWVSELDIVFDDARNWYFGTGSPGPAEYDFESVALHELGHGHQLDHVIDPVVNGNNMDDVMHWAISNGESQKVIGTNNSTAANNIQTRSESTMLCAQPLMTGASCQLSVDEDQLEEVISVFPNPHRGQFQIKNASFINLQKAVIYDISGRQISVHDLTNSQRAHTIDMLGVSSGVYFVNIQSNLASITKKIVLR